MDYSLLNFKKTPIKFIKPRIKELLFSFDPNLVKVTNEFDAEKDEFARFAMKIFSVFCFRPPKICPGIKYIYWNHPTKPCPDCVIPDGLCVIKSFYSKQRLKSLYDMFNHHTRKIIPKGIFKEQSYGTDKNVIFLWEEPFGDVIAKLMKVQPDLGKEILFFINTLFGMLQIKTSEKKKYADTVQITLVKYKTRTGLFTHVDNIRRAGSGPILSLSVGPDKTVYDLIPLKKDYGKSLRVFVNNGDIVVMNGDVRWKWAHSLPYEYAYRANGKSISFRFALLIRLPKASNLTETYDTFWREKTDSDSICKIR